jgi:O-antigen chain-terminating methyltransferase
LLNSLIQAIKKAIARGLRWFVRDQVTFNREIVRAVETILEALNDQNRAMISLAAQVNEQLGYARGELGERVRELSRQIDVRAGELAEVLRGETGERIRELSRQIDVRAAELNEALRRDFESVRSVSEQAASDARSVRQRQDALAAEASELKDIRRHWIEWRADWEKKLAINEIQFLRSAADLQGAFQHRVTQVESNFREMVSAQHGNYLGALDRANVDIQKRLWADLEQMRANLERTIHNELRVVRRRAAVANGGESGQQTISNAVPGLPFDYGWFAERFRGSEEYVRRNQAFYAPFFAGRANVLDIGCGRGEMLEMLRDRGVSARGIELSEECVALCRSKGLATELADVFAFLPEQSDEEFDGMLASQVVEHLPPERLPDLIRLCAAKLRRDGVLAIETPNPECLAIFATHFYLDPTHTRPVPSALLSFYLEEAGFGRIEVHPLSPAEESLPEVAELPEGFRKRFFGGLDYAIIARKL